MRSETLIFVEFPEQIRTALRAARRSEPHHLIALSPHAEYALERQNLSFSRPEDYYDLSELEELGFENFSKAENFTSYVDAFLQQEIPLFAQSALRPAWFHFFWWKRLFDGVTLRLFEIKNLLINREPKEVIYLDPGKDSFDEWFPWRSEESVYSRVIQHLCQEEKISSKRLPFSYKRITSTKQYDATKARLLGKRSLIDSVRRRLVGLCQNLGRRETEIPTTHLPAILFQGSSSNLEPVIRRLSREAEVWLCSGNNPFGVAQEPPRCLTHSNGLWNSFPRQKNGSELEIGRLIECWRKLQKDGGFRKFFEFDRWDWFDLVATRVEDFFLNTCRKTYETYRDARCWIEKIRPKVFVAHSLAYYQARAVAHAARQNSVPVAVIPHGPFGQADVPMVRYEDPPFADYLLAYGEGMANYLNRYGRDGARPIVAGSPRLDSLPEESLDRGDLCRVLKIDPQRKVAIYVMNNLDGNTRYLSCRQCSDSRSFQIQRRIVEVFRNHAEVQLIVKGHPARNLPSSPIVDYIRDQKLSNSTYIASVGFSRLLTLADAFVFDYAATALLEAMTTDTPIYLFNDFLRFEPEALEVLKRRTIFHNDLEEFCGHLEKDLVEGTCFEKRLTDKGYLRLYGSPDDGSKSVQRIAGTLLEIAQNRMSEVVT